MHDTSRCRLISDIAGLEKDDEAMRSELLEMQNIAEKNLRELSKESPMSTTFTRLLGESLVSQGEWFLRKGKTKEGRALFEKNLELQRNAADKAELGDAWYWMAVASKLENNLLQSVDYLKNSESAFRETGNMMDLAPVLTELGDLYFDMGNIPLALEYIEHALKLGEQSGNRRSVAYCFRRMAVIYESQGDQEKPLVYLFKSLKIEKDEKNEIGLGQTYHTIAYIYGKYQDYGKALEYYTKSLEVRERIGDMFGVGYGYNNVGSVYLKLNQDEKAIEYFDKSRAIFTELNEVQGLSTTLGNLGSIYLKRRDAKKAIRYGEEALQLAQKAGYVELTGKIAHILYGAYKLNHQTEPAFRMFDLHVKMKDSISNEVNKKASIKSQLKYEYEKKLAVDSVRTVEEKRLSSVQLKEEQTRSYALFGGLGLTLIFAGFMLNRLRLTRRQKQIIEAQKQTVEDQKTLVDLKQKEIMDSIYYARRIQRSLLPTEKYITRMLNRLM
jgi:tetratricopeptide (TPR) repeat protein